MSLQINKDPYAAACNPPRRAKRPRIDLPSSSPRHAPDDTHTTSPPSIHPRPILPKRAFPSSTRPTTDTPPHLSTLVPLTLPTSTTTSSEASSPPPTPVPTTHPPPPGKRGRKPGPLSRSAREAQRRLNHSIIEKARRTKINNALATLKQLVPLDYGKSPLKGMQQGPGDNNNNNNHSDDGDEGDGDDDDDDGDYGKGKKQKANKPPGKKEEKEREYKLEILVRTVTFMQDLLQRVATLEKATQTCSSCGVGIEQKQVGAKQETITSSDPSDDSIHRKKRSRTATDYHQQPLEQRSPLPPPSNPTLQEPALEPTLPRHRLPSISSWLPETLIDPSIFNRSSPSRSELARGTEPFPHLQLPTPPSSIHLNPLPLHLVAAAATSPIAPATAPSSFPAPKNTGGSSGTRHPHKTQSPTRTPEDESAASMLLQISGTGFSSPIFRPLPPSVFPFSGTASPHYPNDVATDMTTSSATTTQVRPGGRRVDSSGLAVQTPASLLGLVGLTTT